MYQHDFFFEIDKQALWLRQSKTLIIQTQRQLSDFSLRSAKMMLRATQARGLTTGSSQQARNGLGPKT